MFHTRIAILTTLLVLAALPPAIAEIPLDTPAPLDGGSVQTPAARVDTSLSASSDLHVIRVSAIRAAAPAGLAGSVILQLGAAPAVAVPVHARQGGAIAAMATFQRGPEDNSLDVAIVADDGRIALHVSGDLRNGTLYLRDNFVDTTLLQMEPGDASVTLAGGPISGEIEIRAAYTTWRGHRQVLMGVLPALPTDAPYDLNATAERAPAQEPGFNYTAFSADGPTLDAAYLIVDGPLAIRYSILFLDDEGQPVLGMRGVYDWQDAARHQIGYVTAPDANKTLREVSFRPVRTSDIATLRIGNELLLGAVAPSHETAQLDPSREIHVVCEGSCPAPKAPWEVRVGEAWDWVKGHGALMLVIGAALVVVLLALAGRPARTPEAEERVE